MAKGPAKRGGGGVKLPKKWMKFMIWLVGLTMLLSGVYSYGISREIPDGSANQPTAFWKEIDYNSSQILSGTAVVKVVAISNQLKLRPNQMSRLDERDFSDIFESNITGVRDIVFENMRTDGMFHFDTEWLNVSDEIKKRIRVSGGYTLYRVYRGSTPMGGLDVVAEDLRVGDYARVLLLQRTRNNMTETLGFAQAKLPVGPVLNVTVVGDSDGYYFDAITHANVSREAVSAVLNATSIDVSEVNDTAGNASVVSFNMPQDTDVDRVKGVLAGMGMEDVTVNRFGFVRASSEMVVDGQAVTIPGSDKVRAVMRYDSNVNDTIMAQIYTLSLGNQTMVYAREISGIGTIAQ